MALDQISFINDTLFSALPYGLVCLSFVVTFKYLRFPDVTCSGSFVLGGAIAAVSVVKGGLDPVTATLLAAIGGAFAGALTAFFYTVLRLDRLLSGILSGFTLYSVNLILLTPIVAYNQHATLLSTLEDRDRRILAGDLAWHPFVIAFLSIFVLATKLLLDRFLRSEVGLAMRSLEDEEAGEYVLERQGLTPGRFKLLGLALGNAIVGVAGALTSYKEGAAYADRGFDLLITGLVAFLVGTQLLQLVRAVVTRISIRINRPLFEPNISTFAILGALAYFGLMTLSQRMRVPPEYTKILLVVLVALSVAQPTSVLRAFSRRRREPLQHQPDILLSVRNLAYRYPSADTDALKGLSFDIRPGSVTKLSGGNGAGKTTALRVIGGFLEAVHGSHIRYEGSDVTEKRADRLERIAYVDQNVQRGVVASLSTEENLALAAIGASPSIWRQALSGATRKQILDVIRFADLPTGALRRRADQLSGGQRQVLNLLSLLTRKTLPQVILLDEPTNNLDVANTARCRQIIDQLHQDGAAIVLVSHTPLAGLHIDHEVELGGVGSAGRGTPGSADPAGLGANNEREYDFNG